MCTTTDLAKAFESFGERLNYCSIEYRHKETNKKYTVVGMWAGFQMHDNMLQICINFPIFTDGIVYNEEKGQTDADWCDIVESGHLYFAGETNEERLFNFMRAFDGKSNKVVAAIEECDDDIRAEFEKYDIIGVIFHK